MEDGLHPDKSPFVASHIAAERRRQKQLDEINKTSASFFKIHG